jgi:hypothetical protein
MARLALGVVGAFIGSFGGPAGAQAGFMIGSAVGGLFEPPQRVQGPRLEDLKVQSSSYGGMIPIYYGAMRGAGNLIWSTDIRETETTESAGKGGPSVETTNYTYSVDCAIAICEGEIAGIEKIWANGKLIYNVGPDADADTIAASHEFATSFTVYNGTTTQLPDPTIEADKGVGNVPAYRGTAYVVFENLQLADYGNRIPNFEFKVIGAGSTSITVQETLSIPSGFMGYIQTYFDVAHNPVDGQYDYVAGLVGGHTNSVRTYTHYTTNGGLSVNVQNTVAIPSGVGTTIGTSKDIVSGKRIGNHFYAVLNSGFDGTCTLISDGAISADLRPTTSTSAAWWYDELNASFPMFGGLHWYTDDYLYMGVIRTGSTNWNSIYRWSLNSSGLTGAEKTASNICTSGNTKFCMYVYENTYIYALNATRVLKKYDTDLNLISSTDLSSLIPTGCIGFGITKDNKMYFALTSGVRLYNLDTNTLEKTYSATLTPYPCRVLPRNGLVYVQHGATVLCLYFGSLTGSVISLGDIVLDQCERSGLSASDVDVTELTDSVEGYKITRQASARQNIAQLQKAYFFDAVESDNVIKFKKRGAASAVTIPYEDLAAHEVGQTAPDGLSIVRTQEVDLPATLTVNYINVDADYQLGSESSRRLVTPSEQQVSEELAIAMDKDKAAQIAEVLMYDAYMGRCMHTFQTTKKYAKYEPTDIVTISSNNASYRVRIVKKDEEGAIIKWQAVQDDAAVYTSNAVGSSPSTSQALIAVPGITHAEYLDIPILRDEDDNAGFYVAMTGYTDNWHGASLFRSSDNITYGTVGSVFNNATIGACDTALGNWTGGNMFDESNTVDITLYYGTLSSATRDEVLNGANVILIGNEIIQFRTATLTGTLKYRLSGLLRGRRGTEQYMSTHAIGDRAVLLTVAGTLRPNEGAFALNAVRYYKPASFGNSLTMTMEEAFTNTGVGLMPLSPVHLAGGKQSNGDFIISWKRRTRVDGNWRDYVDAALGESSESYEIDIMNGSTVVRTLTSTTNSVTYSSASQTSDWGSPQSTITVNVYQLSSVVGRGFAATKTY